MWAGLQGVLCAIESRDEACAVCRAPQLASQGLPVKAQQERLVPLSRLQRGAVLLEPDQALILGFHQVCASLFALHFSSFPCTISDCLQMSYCTAHDADWQKPSPDAI